MKLNYFSILLVVFSASVFAEKAMETGNVSWLLVHNGPENVATSKRVLINIEGEMAGGFCTDKNWAIVFDNEAANAQYSLLLAAYMSGKKVKLTGNSTAVCSGGQDIVRNIEFINY